MSRLFFICYDKGMKFNYDWNLKDGYPAKGVKAHHHTVMSTFACGGGSSMGYKLAGYDVVAANDIDPQMARIYQENHHPKQFFLCPVKDLLTRDDLPTVDVLDGSPPCSTFSLAGSREKAWGVEKKFREGQAKQELDKLFFDFIDVAEKMQPKVVIAENVEGIIRGKAVKYVNAIVARFKKMGYNIDIFLCDGTNMGLPQMRRRVFFVANRLGKHLKLSFNEPPITFGQIRRSSGTPLRTLPYTTTQINYWHETKPGCPMGVFLAGAKKLALDKVPFTVASSSMLYDALECRTVYKEELDDISSFPHDYNYLDASPNYVQGMSVPPVMMAQVAYEVYKQLLSDE